MKKLLSILFLAIITLAGCGASGETGNGELGGSIDVAVDEGYVEYMTNVGTKFKEEKGVDVNVINADMFTTLEALPTQQGNTADVFMLPNDRIGDLANQKLLSPVEVSISEYTDTAQLAASYNDNNYMLPMATDTSLFIYNKKLLSEVPKTLKELEPSTWAAKYTDFYITAGLFYDFGSYIFGKGNTDTADIGLDTENAVKAGEAISSLYGSGAEHWELMKDDTVAYDIMMDTFKKGKISAMINGPWALQEVSDAGIDYGIAPVPTYSGSGDYAALTGTKGLGINAYSKNIEASQEFLKYLATPENATEFYKATSEVNPHNGVVYEAGSNEEIILEATKNGTSMPTNPAFGKVWEPMADALKQIASGEDVITSLKQAVETLANSIASM